MRNHLIVGLGGTGGRVIRELRKRIMLEHRANEVDGIEIGYLYVDSSREMMDQKDDSWRALGRSVQLPQSSQLLITGASIREVLRNARDFPAVRPWIGSAQEWEKVPANVINEGMGGQRRRLGRFLFAMKARAFETEFNNKLADIQRRAGNNGVHIHVVTGLAGGTGGGCFIDVLALIARNHTINWAAPEGGGRSRISLFALLPDRNPKQNWNTGNYFANGYAALRELNGLLIGKLKPYDLLGTGERQSFETEKLKGVYLVTNENAAGVALSVDSEVPVMISDFLYERLLESRSGQSPIATNENSDFGPENVFGTAEPVRSRSFSSFGITRIEYPENEIREFLAENVAKSTGFQLRYNNWTDEFGFIDRPVNTDHRSRLVTGNLLERWNLGDDYLKYVLPILDQDKAPSERWKKTIDGEWGQASSFNVDKCSDLPRARILVTLSADMEEFSQKFSHGPGVPQFYGVRQDGFRPMATRIAQSIEADLLKNWRDGVRGWSLEDQIDTLVAVRDYVQDKGAQFERRSGELRKLVQETELDLASLREEFTAVSIVRWPFVRQQLLENFAGLSTEHYIMRTEAEAIAFASGLVPVLLSELAALQSKLERVRAMVAQAIEKLNNAITSRLSENGTVIVGADRRFDRGKVQQINDAIARNKSEMLRVTAAIRETLLDSPLLQMTPTYDTFLTEAERSGDRLDQRLEQRCLEEISTLHDNIVQNDADRVLGINLLQRLRTELGGDQSQIDAAAREVAGRAQPFVQISQTERVRNPVMVGAAPGAAEETAFVVRRPNPPEMRDFVDRLDQAFRNARAGVEIADSRGTKSNGLTAVAVTAGLPIRFFAIAKLLQEKYRDRLSTTVDLARLEIHTEDEAIDLPDLFPETGPPAGALGYLLLGRAMSMVGEEVNSSTGRKEIRLRTMDGDGLVHLQKIANAWSDLPETLEPKDFLSLKASVDVVIRKEVVHQDKKKEVFSTVTTIVREVGSTFGHDSDQYNAHLKSVGGIKAILGLAEG